MAAQSPVTRRTRKAWAHARSSLRQAREERLRGDVRAERWWVRAALYWRRVAKLYWAGVDEHALALGLEHAELLVAEGLLP